MQDFELLKEKKYEILIIKYICISKKFYHLFEIPQNYIIV